jgi:hypothetical protein
MTYILTRVAFVCLALSLSHESCLAAAAAWHQDDLVQKASVIAIVEIEGVQFNPLEATVITNGQKWSTSLTIYQSAVLKTVKGEIPERPFILQFSEEGDMNPFEKGRYLVFLRESGGIYFPLATEFKIEDNKINWYKQPFRHGDYGPFFGSVPLANAISDVQAFEKEQQK